MLNRVVLIGRLTRDPEMRYTPSGVANTKFSIAVDRGYKKADGTKETDFINIETWRKLAELCADNLSKGKMVAIDGQLNIDKWQDQDGNWKERVKVKADTVRFISPKNDISNIGEVVDDNDCPFD
jgi:single-strand DNA-binding protein